jgi:hypothetical protein
VFEDVRSEVSLRISRLNDLVAAIRNAEAQAGIGMQSASGQQAMSVVSPMRDAKGLVFVHLYGTYEWCVVNAMREATLSLRAHGMVCSQLRPSLFSLAFNADLDSIHDGRHGDRWRKRAGIFSNVFCTSVAKFEEGAFPYDGSHMRVSQVGTIWSVLGIGDPVVPDGRLIGRVNELVELRNGIAHGRVRADEVGRRFSVAELQSRIKDVYEYCLYVVGAIEDHVTKVENVSRR